MNPVHGLDTACYTVSVRELCEFAAKTGDLDMRFTPAPTAQQGRQGHLLMARRRGPHYESEVGLTGRYEGLLVRGRADGFDPVSGLLEEYKTFRGSLQAMAQNQRALHWAQLKTYGHLLCETRGLGDLGLSLVYLDVGDQSEYPLTIHLSAQELKTHFDGLCQRFLGWAEQELRHRHNRDAALEQLEFPQLPFRPGQRDMAAAVYRACVQSQTLLVQAPTGIGKTLATVYPALRAMPVRGTDKLFFLTAKTPGRQVALDALAHTRRSGAGALPLRVVEMVARDKACEHPDKACHGQSCPLASGFYDRLPQARTSAVQIQWLDQAATRQVALAHAICPYYLSQDLVKWSDVVVGDYNYYFDRSAMLHALTLESQWRVALLVDEAHNLYQRACAMYSGQCSLDEALRMLSLTTGSVRARLTDWVNQWQILLDDDGTGSGAPQWQLLNEVPQAFAKSLQRLISALGEFVNDHPTDTPADVLAFFFRLQNFAFLADEFADHSLCELDVAPLEPDARLDNDSVQQAIVFGGLAHSAAGRITLRNVVPAYFLAGRWQAADASVLFSATLHPQDYFVHLLGLPDTTPRLDIPTPFRPEQLCVRVLPVSTRREQRSDTLGALVRAIAAQYRSEPGNYLAFFSSFAYLEQALQAMAVQYPTIPIWSQSRDMPEAQRDQFLQRLHVSGQGVAFAVLGGAFAEGIDLPGKRLIGAFIATLGLPQFDPVNQAICERMEQRFGRGYDYVYAYPGLQKVVQAAGRVIRTEQDTGTVWLMDARYLEQRYRQLLPPWWRLQVTTSLDAVYR